MEDTFLGTVFKKISELIPEWFMLAVAKLRLTQVNKDNAPFHHGLI